MVVLRIPPSLNVPILDGPNDVGLVTFAELDFNLIPLARIWVLQKQVESTCPRLDALLVLEHKVAEAQQRWVLGNAVLHPSLIEFGMILKPDFLRLDIGEGHRSP